MRKYFFFTFIIALLSFNAQAQNEKLEATYIYNFIKYVNWPESAKSGDFVIGVLGASGVTLELRKLALTKKAMSQKISVVEFSSTNDITKCHILFVTRMASGTIKEAVAKVSNNPTLIVSEFPGLASQGSGINFITKDGKLTFQMNETAIKRYGLQVSSQLLELSVE